MINAIEIENFKAIGKRQRVELKPITLLFGPNSAGKSTVLHAIHYAREILERHNLNADQTVTGGEFVDLGGFQNFIHGHKVTDRVGLKFEFKLDDLALPDFMYAKDDVGNPMPTRLIGEQVRSASVEVGIEWSELEQRPVVARYAIGLNGEAFGQLDYQPGRKTVQLTELNWMHAIFSDLPDQTPDDLEHPLFSQYLQAFSLDKYDTPYDVQVLLAGQEDALPRWDSLLPLQVRQPKQQNAADRSRLSDEDRAREDERERAEARAAEEFSACVTQLIAGPGEILRDMLRDLRYLGPLREKPDRRYQPPRFPDPSRWASGIGAWDVLHAASPPLLDRINLWMSGDNTINAGYVVRRKRYKELDAEGPLMLQLVSGRAFDDVDDLRSELSKLPTCSRVTLVEERTQIEVEPQDVGEGISQILPVVVALLAPGPRLVAVEQPELHVHPRIQVAIGDLLIEKMRASQVQIPDGASWYRESMIIETHSEHLLLRILKRIRQTARQTLPSNAKPVTPEEVAVLYVEPLDDGIRMRPLRVDETGEFLDHWPHGFFEERGEELFT